MTNAVVEAAEKRGKPYEIADADGLYLYVSATGSKSWRMKFRFRHKEKLLTFGPYPGVTLKAARGKRDDARALIRDNVDPSGVRKRAIEAERAAAMEEAKGTPFEEVARRWHALQAPRWAPVNGGGEVAEA